MIRISDYSPQPNDAKPVPTLSVVLIAYNMARELPRTLTSLSSRMQLDIREEDYEIIVVDNGSSIPVDINLFRDLGCNIAVHRMDNATVSPVPAINFGLRQARGDLIGVLIDGARIASPRLLATALEAAQLHPRPVIGTLSFHLGPDLQKRSILQGYCQAVEDKLLAESGWEHDGYRLFRISVLAGSSEDGWFMIPAETNAMFLRREHWESLGGYDPDFVSPGGGLANLDMWARACAEPMGRVVMLLGEATFHQIHGGVATNSITPSWPSFHDEFVRIRGRPYVRPEVVPLLLGRPHPDAIPSISASAERYLTKSGRNAT